MKFDSESIAEWAVFTKGMFKLVKGSHYGTKQKETAKPEKESGTIKDSGERREFSTGAVRDIQVGKGRYDLIPWEAIHELALHCEEGALKYGERNCEKGIPTHSLVDSAMRHLSCYLRGMKDEPHLRAAMWNVAMLIWTEKRKPEMQDIPCRIDEQFVCHGKIK